MSFRFSLRTLFVLVCAIVVVATLGLATSSWFLLSNAPDMEAAILRTRVAELMPLFAAWGIAVFVVCIASVAFACRQILQKRS